MLIVKLSPLLSCNSMYKLLPLFSVLLLIGCGGSGSSDDSEVITPVVDTPVVDTPVVDDTGNDETPSTSPNILFILSDDQGLDASAQYSYSTDLPNTENLNNLAEQGITYTNAWATPACTTTRASILTGKHGINSGVTYVPAQLDPSLQTLPEYLKADIATSHYQSAVFGKWHLGGAQSAASHPNDSGVEHYAGNLGNLNDYYNWELTVNGQTSTVNEYHTTKLTDLAIDWIAEQSTPWFVWLAYSAPHSPFHLPPASLHNRSDLTGNEADINANKRDYYLAAIEAMDSEIGRLIASLPADEQDNTIIIFMGDNGTPKLVIDTSVFDKEHAKGSLYEGGIRVPLLISGKGVHRYNEFEGALVNSVDLFATIVELAGSNTSNVFDSQSFVKTLTSNEQVRNYNYSEFESDTTTGWVVRDGDYKLIEFANGDQQLFDVENDLAETNDLLLTAFESHDIVHALEDIASSVRNTTTGPALDITNQIFENRSANCSAYVERYSSNVLDVNNSTVFAGDLVISTTAEKCIFNTNAIPNHDFNDGDRSFPNNVTAQNDTFEITNNPSFASTATDISLQVDNAILLNGVKVDLLAAGCFGVGNGKVGCNDMSQPWRYDPMSPLSGFSVDSHNAHAQPDGTYHYHGTPNAFYQAENNGNTSPVVGFAADGFPILGPFFDDNGTVRKALPSYQVKSGVRPTTSGSPGGNYDGTYRDDNEYVEGLGDLDECNGMTVDGVYGYYITDGFPYVLGCFKGSPDASFYK
ncbi:sulfatase-like hydrolase/transferase [Thalassotalea psychrophila]|uniref:Sulfatase-like hydrolase/transferase n=1 Tax=Thalassotalea psychrophila TaxID=3065647 RepID=A0ABY9TPT4_9GAMM|nr:sulfatase-like hydrolase/transferase [Colwelliaceae bacterium SQ149]